MNCPTCSGELRFVEQYQRFYCDKCGTWPEVAQQQPQAQMAAQPAMQPQPQMAAQQGGGAAFEVTGEIIPSVTFNLAQGQHIRAQPGVMIFRDPSVQMQTKTHGGMMKGLGRKMLGGESMSMTEFHGPGRLSVSGGAPGKIIPIELRGNAMRAKSGAFIACDSGVEMEVTTEKIGTAIIGGTGLFQLRFFGNGHAFIQAKGDIITGSLGQGQSIIADENAFLACDDSVQRNRERVEGARNILTGGEGLYLLKMTGPGRYWLETGGGLIDWIMQVARK